MAINPYDKAHELAKAIAESQQYLNYVEAKKLIDRQPELKERLLQFRSLQMELNRLQVLGEEIDKELLKQVATEFTELNKIEELTNFFTAEGHFITLFNDIQQVIQKKIESTLE